MGFLKSLLTVAFLLLLAHAAPVANPEDKTLWSQSLLLKDQMPSVEYKFGKSIGLWGQHPPPLLDLRDPKYPKAVTKLSEATHYIEPTQGKVEKGKPKIDLLLINYEGSLAQETLKKDMD